MATVRITEILITHVTASIEAAFQARAERITAKINERVEACAVELYDHLVDNETKARLAAVPEEFLLRSTRIHASVGSENFVFDIGSLKPVHGEWMYTPGVPSLEGLVHYDEIRALQRAREDVHAERIELTKKVKTLMRACVTLNQVVTVWPTILQHIPREALERHNTPTTRAKPLKPALDAIMDDEFKSSLVKASILAPSRAAPPEV